jgi:hypothetical protein
MEVHEARVREAAIGLISGGGLNRWRAHTRMRLAWRSSFPLDPTRS